VISNFAESTVQYIVYRSTMNIQLV